MADLRIRVTPRSSQEKVEPHNNGLRVWVNAPPAENQANEAVLCLLAKTLKIPKSSLSITHGSKGRDKRVQVSGITQEQLDELIRSLHK